MFEKHCLMSFNPSHAIAYKLRCKQDPEQQMQEVVEHLLKNLDCRYANIETLNTIIPFIGCNANIGMSIWDKLTTPLIDGSINSRNHQALTAACDFLFTGFLSRRATIVIPRFFRDYVQNTRSDRVLNIDFHNCPKSKQAELRLIIALLKKLFEAKITQLFDEEQMILPETMTNKLKRYFQHALKSNHYEYRVLAKEGLHQLECLAKYSTPNSALNHYEHPYDWTKLTCKQGEHADLLATREEYKFAAAVLKNLDKFTPTNENESSVLAHAIYLYAKALHHIMLETLSVEPEKIEAVYDRIKAFYSILDALLKKSHFKDMPEYLRQKIIEAIDRTINTGNLVPEPRDLLKEQKYLLKILNKNYQLLSPCCRKEAWSDSVRLLKVLSKYRESEISLQAITSTNTPTNILRTATQQLLNMTRAAFIITDHCSEEAEDMMRRFVTCYRMILKNDSSNRRIYRDNMLRALLIIKFESTEQANKLAEKVYNRIAESYATDLRTYSSIFTRLMHGSRIKQLTEYKEQFSLTLGPTVQYNPNSIDLKKLNAAWWHSCALPGKHDEEVSAINHAEFVNLFHAYMRYTLDPLRNEEKMYPLACTKLDDLTLEYSSAGSSTTITGDQFVQVIANTGADTSFTLVTGNRGSGKSTFARSIFASVNKNTKEKTGQFDSAVLIQLSQLLNIDCLALEMNKVTRPRTIIKHLLENALMSFKYAQKLDCPKYSTFIQYIHEAILLGNTLLIIEDDCKLSQPNKQEYLMKQLREMIYNTKAHCLIIAHEHAINSRQISDLLPQPQYHLTGLTTSCVQDELATLSDSERALLKDTDIALLKNPLILSTALPLATRGIATHFQLYSCMINTLYEYYVGNIHSNFFKPSSKKAGAMHSREVQQITSLLKNMAYSAAKSDEIKLQFDCKDYYDAMKQAGNAPSGLFDNLKTQICAFSYYALALNCLSHIHNKTTNTYESISTELQAFFAAQLVAEKLHHSDTQQDAQRVYERYAADERFHLFTHFVSEIQSAQAKSFR